MNTLATAVRMLSQGRQSSDRMALSAAEREALKRISSLLDGSTRRLATALDEISTDMVWVVAPERDAVTG